MFPKLLNRLYTFRLLRSYSNPNRTKQFSSLTSYSLSYSCCSSLAGFFSSLRNNQSMLLSMLFSIACSPVPNIASQLVF